MHDGQTFDQVVDQVAVGHFEANNSHFYLISAILTQIGPRNVGRFRKYYRT